MASISLENINITYFIEKAGQKPTTLTALKNLSLNLNDGDRVGIIGRNGGGKSTLLKVLSESVTPHSGEVSIEGDKLSLLNRMTGLLPEASLYQNAKIKAYSLGLNKAESAKFVTAVLEESRMKERSKSPLRSLSTGMSGRFNIALNSQVIKPITILDEWVGTLESPEANQNSLLDRLIKETKIVVLASHNEQLIRELCNRVILVENGEIIYNGTDLDQGFEIFTYLKDSINKKNNELLEESEPELHETETETETEYNRKKVHFIDVGRTSLPYISKVHKGFISNEYTLVFHDAHQTIANVPHGEKICILYRDPVKRFISAFFSRRLNGQPIFNIQWSLDEEKIFNWFKTPNCLAEAISSSNKEERNKALFTLGTMNFLKTSYDYYFTSINSLKSRRDNIIYSGNMENPKETIKNLCQKLSIDESVAKSFTDPNEALILQQESSMSELALKNIQNWYEQDYKYINFFEEL